MAMRDLKELAVTPFGTQRRTNLFLALQALLGMLHTESIEGELWVDGSFLTQKPEPSDVDMILRFRSDQYNSLDGGTFEKRSLIDSVTSEHYYKVTKCEVIDLIEYPRGHEKYGDSLDARRYWTNTFGTARDDITEKGIVVVELLDGAPGSWN
ncbi:MAG: hypothetical protein OXN91_06950 [Chloroflexota bacterium]|nr:hypothetical protein [Chloroflexota bacterium]